MSHILFVDIYSFTSIAKELFSREMKHGKMTTNSGRPRRKCVSVSFVGDDDVIGHIVDVNKKYGMYAS